jgi:hypothetical protein
MRKKVLKWSQFFKIDLRIRTDTSLKKCPGEPPNTGPNQQQQLK